MFDYDAFIFDFDGTLYDFRHLPLRLVLSSPLDALKVRAEHSVRRTLKGVYFKESGMFYRALGRLLAMRAGFPSDAAALKWYMEFYSTQMVKVLRENYRAREFATEVLAKLREQKKKLAVFSDYDAVKERMKAVGLSPELVDFCFSAGELGGLKPAQIPFLKIAERLGADPQRILVIGDRDDTDGEGSRKANMAFLQIVTHKTTRSELMNSVHKILSWEAFAKEVLQE